MPVHTLYCNCARGWIKKHRRNSHLDMQGRISETQQHQFIIIYERGDSIYYMHKLVIVFHQALPGTARWGVYLGVSGYINLVRLEENNLSTMSILSQKSSDCFSSLLPLLTCSFVHSVLVLTPWCTLASASLFILLLTFCSKTKGMELGTECRERALGLHRIDHGMF